MIIANKKLQATFVFMGALIFITTTLAKASIKPMNKKLLALSKNTELKHEQFNGNNIACWMSNDGTIVSQKYLGKAGMEWPKGSGNTIDYNSGLWFAGKTPTGEIRSASVEYSSEFLPGPILPDGTPADPSNPAYRIYKINNDGTGDWDSWPFEQGAPAVKAKDGSDSLDVYGHKIPLLIGDQTLFWVMNDADVATHYNMFGSQPMGVEVHVLVYGFNEPEPLSNTMFIQWTFINKSTTNYLDCYVGLWDDPDVGYASNDLVGCDTTLGLGYCYNGTIIDSMYQARPPALGFDFLSISKFGNDYSSPLMTSFTYFL